MTCSEHSSGGCQVKKVELGLVKYKASEYIYVPNFIWFPLCPCIFLAILYCL